MDAVAGKVESDPDTAHRIVGAWLDDEFLGDALTRSGATEDGGVEGIIGLGHPHFDPELATGALVHSPRDTDGAVEGNVAICIDGLEAASCEGDAQVVDAFAKTNGRHVGRDDLHADLQSVEVEGRVELKNEVGIAHAFFCNHFEDGVVGHA